LFGPSATTTTSLASKRELEVVLFIVSTICHHNHLPRVQMRAGGGYFCCFDCLPPPPPPSHPNASWRWLFSTFRRDSHHHHLPRIQMRARGGYFQPFDATPSTSTSLASKRELEVVLFGDFKASATAAAHYHCPRIDNGENGQEWEKPTKGMWEVEKRASRIIERDMGEEGQGATTTCSLSFPRALVNDPFSFVRGFLLWPWRRGSSHTTRGPIRFFSLFVVNDMYLL